MFHIYFQYINIYFVTHGPSSGTLPGHRPVESWRQMQVRKQSPALPVWDQLLWLGQGVQRSMRQAEGGWPWIHGICRARILRIFRLGLCRVHSIVSTNPGVFIFKTQHFSWHQKNLLILRLLSVTSVMIQSLKSKTGAWVYISNQ